MAVFGKGNSKNRRGTAGYDDQRLQLFSQIEGLMELYVLILRPEMLSPSTTSRILYPQ